MVFSEKAMRGCTPSIGEPWRSYIPLFIRFPRYPLREDDFSKVLKPVQGRASWQSCPEDAALHRSILS